MILRIFEKFFKEREEGIRSFVLKKRISQNSKNSLNQKDFCYELGE